MCIYSLGMKTTMTVGSKVRGLVSYVDQVPGSVWRRGFGYSLVFEGVITPRKQRILGELEYYVEGKAVAGNGGEIPGMWLAARQLRRHFSVV